MAQSVARLSESPWALLRRTLGGPRDLARKARSLWTALRGYGGRRVDERLERLRALGLIDRVPSKIQRMTGAVDMMRFFIVPCASDYYVSKGISFGFHALLRFFDDPASLVDPTGFNSTPDAIIGHIMQVVHANPVYDYQLLQSFEGGLDELERQIEAVLDGSHPRAASITAIVEDPTYHRRLLDHVRAYRRDPDVPPLLRENVVRKAHFARAERIFGTLPGAMAYFAALPTTARGALRHLRTVRCLEDSPAARPPTPGADPSTPGEADAA